VAGRRGDAGGLAPILAGAVPEQVPGSVGAALGRRNCHTKAKQITVAEAYAERLGTIHPLVRQLLGAGSLGKDGKGQRSPIGPVRPAQQLQMCIGGPATRLFHPSSRRRRPWRSRIDAALTPQRERLRRQDIGPTRRRARARHADVAKNGDR